MSNKPAKTDRKDYDVPYRLLPVTELNMSDGIPPEQFAKIPVSGFVRDEVLHEAVELDFSKASEQQTSGAGDSATSLEELKKDQP